jgi:hypothetical protein
MPLRWGGPASISGELTAFGMFRTADGGSSSGFAHQSLALTDGQRGFANIALTPVVQVGHIVGGIQVPANSDISEKEVFYRWPIVHARIVVPTAQSSAFDEIVPDLSDSGAELCVGAGAAAGSFLTERCGISLRDGDATVTLQQAPSVSSPGDGATVTKDTQFSWSRFDGGVHVLQLEPSSSATGPRIYLFTSLTNTLWPDLAGVGVAFPASASYQCAVGGLGPYTSMDDALGPDGLGAPFPSEIRRSFSPTLNVTTSQ